MRGLSVILNSGQGTHVAGPRENAGFKVLIHPKDEFPNLQDFGFELELGTHAAVRIGTKEVSIVNHFQTFLGRKYALFKRFSKCRQHFVKNF